ncbi:hypothetical protein [Methylobacterium sp. Leaf87]|uniref:hypothetical protein n=1 Tax=Methylobacterium sp. Leaf87 TaxID=1736243 RepID=UPI0012E865DC|nr:hypothetical protein [Methylobacterium sp. Leaf87]
MRIATGPAIPAAPPPPSGRTGVARMLSLPTATRNYARAVAAGTFDHLDHTDLGRLSEAMGPGIWAWQYARRLTGRTPWRAGTDLPETVERRRAEQELVTDIAIWERALAVLDARCELARLTGAPRPPPLAVPAEVRAVIEARRLAAEERASRRRGRPGDGAAGPAPEPDPAIRHPPYPTPPT